MTSVSPTLRQGRKQLGEIEINVVRVIEGLVRRIGSQIDEEQTRTSHQRLRKFYGREGAFRHKRLAQPSAPLPLLIECRGDRVGRKQATLDESFPEPLAGAAESKAAEAVSAVARPRAMALSRPLKAGFCAVSLDGVTGHGAWPRIAAKGSRPSE